MGYKEGMNGVLMYKFFLVLLLVILSSTSTFASTCYSVQIGSFFTKDQAVKFLKKAKKETGYKFFIVKTQNGWWTVRTEKVRSKKEAEEFRKKLCNEYRYCAVVVKTYCDKKSSCKTCKSRCRPFIAKPVDYCPLICKPSKEELKIARIAWKYIENNYNKSTGWANAVDRYPASTAWDLSSYILGLFSAYKLGIISWEEFDRKFSKFLATFQKIKLYNDQMPNKAYSALNGHMTDYTNNPTDVGIGWSALDIGRLLTAFKIIKTCLPVYSYDIDRTVLRWNFCNVLDREGNMYGAINKDGKTLYLQEGRTGYEEYAAKGFELWGFKATEAKKYNHIKLIDVYGEKIPVDTRKGANTYVVSESYILQALELGWDPLTEKYGKAVYNAQKKRYLITGIPTAVSEDNVDQPPWFVYNTVYVNGEKWKCIAETGEDEDSLKSISTKAVIGWLSIMNDGYSKLLYSIIKDAYDPNRGWFSGKYEKKPGYNTAITMNTNGIILESILYKSMGPLVRKIASRETYWDKYISSVDSFKCLPKKRKRYYSVFLFNTQKRNKAFQVFNKYKKVLKNCRVERYVNDYQVLCGLYARKKDLLKELKNFKEKFKIVHVPYEDERVILSDVHDVVLRPLGKQEITKKDIEIARTAWRYFEKNYNPKTGMVNGGNHYPQATVEDIALTIFATISADKLGLIDKSTFKSRINSLLSTLLKMKLYNNKLPNIVYNTQNGNMVDFANRYSEKGIGWNIYHIARLLKALYVLGNLYPEYRDEINTIVSRFDLGKAVKNDNVYDLFFDGKKEYLKKIDALGYQHYISLSLRDFDINFKDKVEKEKVVYDAIFNYEIPHSSSNPMVTSDPFILTLIEQPYNYQFEHYARNILFAQEQRYKESKIPTCMGEVKLDRSPWFLYETIYRKGGQIFTSVDPSGKAYPELEVLPSALAILWNSLFKTEYTEMLVKEIENLKTDSGFLAGKYTRDNKVDSSLNLKTNGLILEAILYKKLGNFSKFGTHFFKKKPIEKIHKRKSVPKKSAVKKK